MLSIEKKYHNASSRRNSKKNTKTESEKEKKIGGFKGYCS